MKLDVKSKIWGARGISPVSVADNTATVSQIFDTANYQGAMAMILLGSIADADATFTVLVEDGDDSGLSDNAAVDDQYLTGIEGAAATPTGASFRYDSDNGVKTIGYVGPKRYSRVTITPSGNASAALIAMCWIGMHKRVGPNTSQDS